MRDVDIRKELVSNKIFFGGKNYKYLIGYICNDNKVKPLHVMVEDNDLLAENNTI